MKRLHDVEAIAIDTLATMIGELEAAAVGVDALAASAKVGTLEEIGERRASVNKRIGETRRVAAGLIECLQSARGEVQR